MIDFRWHSEPKGEEYKRFNVGAPSRIRTCDLQFRNRNGVSSKNDFFSNEIDYLQFILIKIDLPGFAQSSLWSKHVIGGKLGEAVRIGLFLSDSEQDPKTLPFGEHFGSSRVNANPSNCFSLSKTNQATVGAIHERARMVRNRRSPILFPVGRNHVEIRASMSILSRSGNTSRAGPHIRKPLAELHEGQNFESGGWPKPPSDRHQIHEITFLPLVKGSLKHGESSEMARINFDDSLYEERGFHDLVVHCGRTTDLSPQAVAKLAKGMVLELFTIAQEYWFPNRKPIPKQVFEENGFPVMLYGPRGLCQETEEGIHVRGSEEAFAWLFEASAKGRKGGLASAKSRRKKSKKKNEAQVNHSQAQVNLSQPGEASLLSSLSSSLSSLSSSSSLNSHNSDKKAPKSKTASAQPESPSAITLTWEAYKTAYAKRHGAEPPKNARIMGQLKHFVSRVPASEAPAIAEFYLSHYGQRYVAAKHPVGMLLIDAEKIRTEWLTGNISTSISARETERSGNNANAVDSYFRKKHEKQNQEREV